MGHVLCEDGDFKRMHRTDKIALQWLIHAKKFGISVIAYKDTGIRVGIKKEGLPASCGRSPRREKNTPILTPRPATTT